MASATTRTWVRRLGAALGALLALITLWLVAAAIVYPPEYVRRLLAWGESDQGDYLYNFPRSPLAPSPTPFSFRSSPDDAQVRTAFASVLGEPDLEDFLTRTGTQAFIVIKDDTVRYEHYFNGAGRTSMLTSFSVAKSFDSVLVGIAIDEGLVGSVNDPITDYLPELAQRDDRFDAITIRHLLLMASGLDFQEDRWALFNGDGALTTYHPDQRAISLGNTNIVDPPGQYFRYNKYHPQLLGMILERATGMSVTEYTQTRLWDPLGMEFGGAWTLDSEASGFEKMEAGLNARAIDYAKLGRLLLDGGRWDGVQVVSSRWVDESTALDPATHKPAYYPDDFGMEVFADGRGFYKYLWYGRLRDGLPSDFAAIGDHGQFLYVSPAHDVVVVRNGTTFGLPMHAWVDAFHRVAGDL